MSLGDATPLSEVKLGRRALTAAEMATIVDMALVLVRDCYVHLPLKRAVHGIDPENDLRRLAGRVRTPALRPSEPEFHEALMGIFNSLHDLHTMYVLPRPYRRRIAFLPWQIEEYYRHPRIEQLERAFVVSKVHAGFGDELPPPGAIVTHWNGTPIERAVELLAARRPGSHPSAAWARAIDGLTFRWMGTTGRPDEDQVILTCLIRGVPREFRAPWRVAQREEDGPTSDGAPRRELALGLDEETEWIRRVKQQLFRPQPDLGDPPCADAFRGILRAARLNVSVEGYSYGYLRIYTFAVEHPDAFVNEVRRLVGELPQDGLVIDVRGNSGGNIVAAERLLQLFAQREVQAEPMRFRNTTVMARVAEHLSFGSGLADAMRRQEYAGVPYSPPTPLAPERVYNDIRRAVGGPVYKGNVALLVDALSYSATDMFAAGFKDHEIGQVIGVGDLTGAGGANVWGYEVLRAFLQDGRQPALEALPREASFTVAVRQASRVGSQTGDPVEHLGVQGSFEFLTRRDVLHGNADLLQLAADWLDELRDRLVPDTTISFDSTFLRDAAAAGGTTLGISILEAADERLDDAFSMLFLLDAVAAANAEATSSFCEFQRDKATRLVTAVERALARPEKPLRFPQIDGALRWLRDVAAAASRLEQHQLLLAQAARALFGAAGHYKRLEERFDTRAWLNRLEGETAAAVAAALAEHPRAATWYRSERWRSSETAAPGLRELLGGIRT